MAAPFNPPPEVRARLKEDVKKAQDLVERLTDPEKGKDQPHPDMPASEIIRASGLAFLWWQKVAAGVEGGYGFVINKMGETPESRPDRPAFDWSAPLYFKAIGGAVGFTLGYESVDSLIVIDTPDAVKAFTSTSFAIDADVGIGIGKLSGQAVGMPLTIPLSDDAAPDTSLQWSVSKGIYADITFKDMLIQRDDSWNKKLYGSDVQPDDVLKGLVPRPPEVFPLFDTLQRAVDRWLDAVRKAVAEAAAIFLPDTPVIVQEIVVVPAEDTKTPSDVQVKVGPEGGKPGGAQKQGDALQTVKVQGRDVPVAAADAKSRPSGKAGNGKSKASGETKVSGSASDGQQKEVEYCERPTPWGTCCGDCKPCNAPAEMQPERDRP